MITSSDIKKGAKFKTKDGRLSVEIVDIDEYSAGVPRVRTKMEGTKETYADTIESSVDFLNDEGFVLVSNIVSEALDMTKSELKKLIKDMFEDEFKKSMADEKKKMINTEEEVKDVVRKMLKKQYRTFWEKSSFFIDKL
jgi:hypothetical protein